MDVQKLSEDKDLIEILEETVSKWCLQIASAVEASNSKVIHKSRILHVFFLY